MLKLESRKALLKGHPFFDGFTDSDVIELAKLAIEKRLTPGEIIATEGDVIDWVYLISSGEIEVDVQEVPRRLMRQGESIGLNQTGFFSATGLRTATLKAIDDVELLGWRLDVFQLFLERHPEFHATMRDSAEKMLRANFIKQAAPFADLPGSVTMALAQKIEQVTVQSGITLFEEGDFADVCYLICSGEVEIFLKDEEGKPKLIDTLGPGRLFGEAAILGTPQRGATVRISQAAQLLVLKAEHLHSLLHHGHTSEALMGLVAEHWRPRQTQNIVPFHRVNEEGMSITILKDKSRARYYQLSEEGWFVWQQLNGQRNLQDIMVELYKAKKFFSPQVVADMILDIAEAGFVFLPELKAPEIESAPELLSSWQRLRKTFRKWRYLRWVFDDVDPLFTRIYLGGWRLVFTWPGQTAIGLVTIVGAFFFALFLTDIVSRVPSASFIILACVAAFFANLASTLIHEIAHGLTVKYYRHDVHRAGIIFGWLGLAAYVDTSDMWLSPRRPRIVVSLAGPYADLFLAGCASFLGYFIPHQTISLFFGLLALMLYYGVLKNLNPLKENDGYAALRDALNASNLQYESVSWLKKRETAPNRAICIYWLICAAFLLLNVSVAFVAQHYLRILLPPLVLGVSTAHLFWLLPGLVVAQFLLSVLGSVRRV
jgi:putative peptide zinc metalloprotease protein